MGRQCGKAITLQGNGFDNTMINLYNKAMWVRMFQTHAAKEEVK